MSTDLRWLSLRTGRLRLRAYTEAMHAPVGVLARDAVEDEHGPLDFLGTIAVTGAGVLEPERGPRPDERRAGRPRLR